MAGLLLWWRSQRSLVLPGERLIDIFYSTVRVSVSAAWQRLGSHGPVPVHAIIRSAVLENRYIFFRLGLTAIASGLKLRRRVACRATCAVTGLSRSGDIPGSSPAPAGPDGSGSKPVARTGMST